MYSQRKENPLLRGASAAQEGFSVSLKSMCVAGKTVGGSQEFVYKFFRTI